MIDRKVNSVRLEEHAKKKLKEMQTLAKTNEREVEVMLGSTKIKKQQRHYFILRENLQLINDYGRHLITNGYTKHLSAWRVVNVLLYFGDFIKKPFRQVDKKDIEKFLSKYSDNSQNYIDVIKRTIKPFFRWLEGEDEVYPDVVKWIKIGRNHKRE